MRTTSSLESYNSELGRKVSARGNFFRFVEKLQDEEFEKSRNFEQLLISGGATEEAKRRRVRDRHERINEAWTSLREKKIDTAGMLNRLTFKGNKIFDDFCNFAVADTDEIADDIEELSEDEISCSQSSESNESSQSIQPNQLNGCKVCGRSGINIVFPCRHGMYCGPCVENLKEHEKKRRLSQSYEYDEETLFFCAVFPEPVKQVVTVCL